MNVSIIKFISIILIAFLICFISIQTNRPALVSNQEITPAAEITNSPFYDQWFFHRAATYAKVSNTSFKNKPIVMVVPHHLTGAHIIADLISTASKFNYSQINLIGPNHHEAGQNKFITSNTPSNQEIINSDHSIGNPLLFIRYYFPQTNFKTYLIKHDANSSDIYSWASTLEQTSPKNSLYIFSLDFSHFLPANTSAQKDQTTLNLINDINIAEILKLTNEYVDSPSGLALCIALAQRLNLTGPHQFHHTNSGYLTNDFSSGVTSYFGLVFFPSSTN